MHYTCHNAIQFRSVFGSCFVAMHLLALFNVSRYNGVDSLFDYIWHNHLARVADVLCRRLLVVPLKFLARSSNT
jgi:hypothetical protein